MDYQTLSFIWFILIGVFLIGYAILDGFDLGVGIIHPFVTKNDSERRISLNSIGPFWDGNEVWLVVFGGALFAMFPPVYASVFSGFYTAFMLLLLALILRAVSLEFRSKVDSLHWKTLWDYAFFFGSFLASFLFGVAVGNMIIGVALSEEGDFITGVLSHLNLYSLLVGALVVTLFGMHGSIYLYLKTEGEFQDRVNHKIWFFFVLFVITYVVTTILTFLTYPHALRNFTFHPVLWLVPVLIVFSLANILLALRRRRAGAAFLSSSVCIALMVGLFGITLFPNLVYDPQNIKNSITYLNGASSSKTLRLGLVIAAIGMPLVLIYTAFIYRVFWGKVRHEGY